MLPPSPPTSLAQLPPRPISFAPNVTPITFIESDDALSSPDGEGPSGAGGIGLGEARLFPPSEGPVQPPTRKRQPPGKRRSQGYIPRPPNAFMLFRADFVRQKHVPGSIETNHGSLSKIIGNCWRNLPLEEKKVWEQRAKHEKAAHKVQYPNYRFKPVHKKKGALAAAAAAAATSSSDHQNADEASSRGHSTAPSSHAYPPSSSTDDLSSFKKPRVQPSEEEELRCEQVTLLLLEGKKGEELAQAVKALDDRRKAALKARENAQRFEGFAGMRKYSLTPGPLMLPSGRGSMSFGAGFGGIMSAPQPTYPQQSPFALNANTTGVDPTFFNPNENAAAGSYLHMRRSSSVPLPGAYGVDGFFGYAMNNAGEEWYMDMEGMVAPPYSEVDALLQQQQQQPSSSGIELPSLLPPPPSGGLTGIANSSLNTDVTSFGATMSMAFNPRVSISRHRAMLGHRRSSSAGAAFGPIAARHHAAQAPYGFGYFNPPSTAQRGEVELQRDDSPLPEADLSLFDPNFLSGSQAAAAAGGHSRSVSMGMMGMEVVDPIAAIAPGPLDPASSMGPLDGASGAMGPLDSYAPPTGDVVEYGGWNPDVAQEYTSPAETHTYGSSEPSPAPSYTQEYYAPNEAAYVQHQAQEVYAPQQEYVQAYAQQQQVPQQQEYVHHPQEYVSSYGYPVEC